MQLHLEMKMGLAEYMIVGKAGGWSVLHDGETRNDYATKEAEFEAAVEAAAREAEYGVPHPALDALARLVRQAPLQCVAIAFLIGVAVARR
jgi:hypothetical protein